jgi:hypothetical protein
LRFFRVCAAAAALVLLSGCETAIRVGIDANDKGGGRVVAVVTLDKDAQRIAGDLKGRLRVDDLTDAGWKVEGPEKVGSDVRVTATKKFRDGAGAARAIHELNERMFSNFKVEQDRSLLRTTTRVSGTVDLAKGIETYSDEDLEREFGSPLGATPDEFAKRVGKELSAAIPITVGVILPGEVESNATTESGGSAAWHPKLGDRIDIVATAKKWNTTPIIFAGVAVTAIGVAVIALRGGRSRRTPRP